MAIPFVKECDLGCGRPVEILYQGAIYDIVGTTIFPISDIDKWEFYETVWSFCFGCSDFICLLSCASGAECACEKNPTAEKYPDFYVGNCKYCWHQAALMLLEQRKERKQ